METLHTKGEWQVDQESDKNLWIIVENETVPLARINQGKFEDGVIECTDEQKANAKLISAAPNMLEVLNEMTTYIQGVDLNGNVIIKIPLSLSEKIGKSINKAIL